MIKKDFHVHTTFCDGKNTPEDLIQKAISVGLTEIGLVCHGYTPFDESFCIMREDIKPFINEINRLKEKYKCQIKVYAGVEYDYYSEMNVEEFDFIIGSVHYVYKKGDYVSVDENKESVINIVNNYYDGDYYAFCEDYYTNLGDIYSKIKPTFIGHFDLVSKFNKNGELFDENNERYVRAWKNCLDKLLSNNASFELNVGAVLRGYKDRPYPSKEQIKYIKERGGKFVMTSDSHRLDTVGKDFEKFVNEIL